MTKDGPPSGGYRFGNRALHDAGMRDIDGPRSPDEVNLEKFLNNLKPEQREQASCLVSILKKENRRASTILYTLREEEGLGEKFALEFCRDTECKDKCIKAETQYSDDRNKLQEDAVSRTRLGARKHACLFVFNSKRKKMDYLQCWTKDGLS